VTNEDSTKLTIDGLATQLPTFQVDPIALKDEIVKAINQMKTEIDESATFTATISAHKATIVALEDRLKSKDAELAASSNACNDFRISRQSLEDKVKDLETRCHFEKDERLASLERLQQAATDRESLKQELSSLQQSRIEETPNGEVEQLRTENDDLKVLSPNCSMIRTNCLQAKLQQSKDQAVSDIDAIKDSSSKEVRPVESKCYHKLLLTTI